MRVIQSQYSNVAPYITKDGSEIRELMHPNVQGDRAQSVAEATITAGDTMAIAQGTPHCVFNTSNRPMKILCACSPAYSHDDTFLLQE